MRFLCINLLLASTHARKKGGCAAFGPGGCVVQAARKAGRAPKKRGSHTVNVKCADTDRRCSDKDNIPDCRNKLVVKLCPQTCGLCSGGLNSVLAWQAQYLKSLRRSDTLPPPPPPQLSDRWDQARRRRRRREAWKESVFGDGVQRRRQAPGSFWGEPTSRDPPKSILPALADPQAGFTGTLNVVGIVNTTVSVRQLGQVSENLHHWGGLEHSAMFVHASVYAKARGSKCVIIEAGANAGTLALLGAKLNCHVYAFEASDDYLQEMRSNIQLNDLHANITVVPGYLGTHVRLSEHVTDKITHLKMDIDGLDFLAVKTINLGRVEHINFEFSPTKFKGGLPTAIAYIRYLESHGFSLYVYCCVTPEQTFFANGAKCLTQANYGHRLRNGQGNPYRETPQAVLLSECVFQVRDQDSPVCAQIMRQQRIGGQAFIRDLGNSEIDIVGFFDRRPRSMPKEVRLKQLEGLRADGLILQEEFDVKRAEYKKV